MKFRDIIYSFALLSMATGCTDYVQNPYDQIVEDYTKNFIKTFGIIDQEHTWGFGPQTDKAGSRADEGDGPSSGEVPEWDLYVQDKIYDVNGNEWKMPPLIKDWERNKVIEFLHRPDATTHSVALNLDKPYFLTHVGNCYSVTSEEAKLPTGHAEDKDHYHALDGTKITSHNQMNYLKVAYKPVTTLEGIHNSDHDENSHWYAVNNFNASSNTNYGGSTIIVGNGKGGSYNFAYKNTYMTGDAYFDNYIVIPGGLIDYRLSSYHYICFDFKGYDPDLDYITFYDVLYHVTLNGEQRTYNRGNVEIKGIYEHPDVNPDKPEDSVFINFLKSDLTYASEQDKAFINDPKATFIVEITKTGYRNLDKISFPDGYYDDWVIRVCGDAVHAKDPRIPSYPHDDADAHRVFVEDLSVAANWNLGDNSSDWDFNDVVFDIKYNKNNTVTLVLRQLGGTLPVYFCDSEDWLTGHHSEELHSYLGYESWQMVNTGTGNTAPAYEFTDKDLRNFVFDFNAKDPDNVHVFIKKDGEMYEMKAEKGAAPSKLCVPSYLAAPIENMKITIPYTRFEQYVENHNINFWEAPVDASNNQEATK